MHWGVAKKAAGTRGGGVKPGDPKICVAGVAISSASREGRERPPSSSPASLAPTQQSAKGWGPSGVRRMAARARGAAIFTDLASVEIALFLRARFCQKFDPEGPDGPYGTPPHVNTHDIDKGEARGGAKRTTGGSAAV